MPNKFFFLRKTKSKKVLRKIKALFGQQKWKESELKISEKKEKWVEN
jgi:hypothetical protein